MEVVLTGLATHRVSRLPTAMWSAIADAARSAYSAAEQRS